MILPTVPETPSPGGERVHAADKLHEIRRILLARGRVILTTALIVVATGLLITLFVTPEFQATATLQIEPLAPEILTFKDVVSVDHTYEGYWKLFQTQSKLIRSRSVLSLASEKLDLAHQPAFAGRKGSPLGRLARWVRARVVGAAEADPEEEALEFLRDGLLVRPLRDSQIIEVSFVDPDPVLARDVANAVVEAYLEFDIRSKSGTTTVAKNFLTKEVARVQAEITELEHALQEYLDRKDILAVSDGTQNIGEQALADLNHRFVEAKGRLALTAARHDSVRAAPAEALPEVLQSPLIARLREQHAEIERRYSQMAQRFKSDWPERVQIRAELEQCRTRLEQETENIASQVRQVSRSDHERGIAEVARLAAEVEAQKLEVQRIQREAIEHARLKAAVESKRRLRNDLVSRQSEAETSAQLKDTRTSNIRVVDMAQTPKKPVRPDKALNLVLSIVLGLVAGIGAGMLVEQLDNTVKSGQDVERLTGLPVLGYVPRWHPLRALPEGGSPQPQDEGQIDLSSHLDPRCAMAEAFRSMRTSLLLAAPDHPPRNILVTSCQPRDGKSTVCLNLSIVLAQMGRRVLIVDADLRLPRLHKVLGLPNDRGLSSYLTGNCTLDGLILPTEVPNLAAVTSGPNPPNPSELLGSPVLGVFLDSVERDHRFDFVIFDSSPLLSVADPLVLAARLDATILVARNGETVRESLAHGIARLRQSRARIAGAVVNGVDHQSDGYYYGPYRYESDREGSRIVPSGRPPRRHARRAKRA